MKKRMDASARRPGLACHARTPAGRKPPVDICKRGPVQYAVARTRHPIKEIEAAVRYAETNDWVVVASGSSAHSWAKLRCAGDCPQRSVWSTPSDPIAHARQIRAYVDRCPHPQEGNAS